MAEEREVTCPDELCGSTWTTRANPRVIISCKKCGAIRRAPEIGAGSAVAAAATVPGSDPGGATDESPSSVATGSPETPGAVVIEEVTSVTTTRRPSATPRNKRTTPKGTPPAERPAAQLDQHQRAGRRGGIASSYGRRVGRG